MADNMEIWNRVCETDPHYAKDFNRSGFKGTAINPVYLIKKATELWGPMGARWGIRNVKHEIIQGHLIKEGTRCQIHCVSVELFYPTDSGEGVIPAIGQTTIVGDNKNGLFTDEEAPKKSLTDALTKALSWLGFSADIHTGKWDDNKYVNDSGSRSAPAVSPANSATVLPKQPEQKTAAKAAVPAAQPRPTGSPRYDAANAAIGKLKAGESDKAAEFFGKTIGYHIDGELTQEQVKALVMAIDAKDTNNRESRWYEIAGNSTSPVYKDAQKFAELLEYLQKMGAVSENIASNTLNMLAQNLPTS